MSAMIFPLARYRFDFAVSTSIHLPDYAGSTLRGAFGHALRNLACMTRAKTCDGCMLMANCPYISVFEPQNASSGIISLATPPVPYIIEPPALGARHYMPGETLSFYFTLIGKGTDHLPLCIMAWRRAFLRGVGAGTGTAELLQVVHETQGSAAVIYRSGETIADHPRHIALTKEKVPAAVTLAFVTPLRLQENGHALPPSQLTPRPLLTALLRRASLLTEYHQNLILYTPAQLTELTLATKQITGQVQMEWYDWTRRSARQQRTMQLGGCIGHWTINGDLSPFWDILRLGEWLHVGKEASFGLGQYRIQQSTAST